jgi:hypothetical protein
MSLTHCLLVVALTTSGPLRAARTLSPPQARTHGSFTIHMILHAVGDEQYDVTANPDGTQTLTTTFDYADRARAGPPRRR